MDKNEIEILNKTVIQANPLIEARKEMNVTEMRLFVLGLQGVKPHIKDNTVYDVDFHETLIPTSQLIGLLGQTYGSISNLKKQLEKAYDSKITLNYKNGGFEFKHIYEEMKYVPEQGLIIKFDAKMKPYILELVGRPYTKYKVRALFSLSSAYAWRILELLLAKQGYFKKGYQDVYIEYEIEKLRELLNVKKDLYKLVNNFRRRVLDEPIKEINTKTDYFVWYDVLREGRRIKGFRLWMKVNLKKTETENTEVAPALTSVDEDILDRASTQSFFELPEEIFEEPEEPSNPAVALANEYADETNWSDEQQADYDALIKCGVWAKTAHKIVETYDHARIERNRNGCVLSNPKGNIRDLGAVVVSAINSDIYQWLEEAGRKAKEREEKKKKEAWEAQQKAAKEKEEQNKKDKERLAELAKIREQKPKEELIATFELVFADYHNNNESLTDEMVQKLESKGIPKEHFSLYKFPAMRKMIKYIQ